MTVNEAKAALGYKGPTRYKGCGITVRCGNCIAVWRHYDRRPICTLFALVPFRVAEFGHCREWKGA